MPRRRGRPSSGGREAILDAALELVRTEGVAKLTSREVAARAGVSDASVYYHFRDRRGLLIAVFEHGMKPKAYIDNLPEGADWREVLAQAFTVLESFYGDLMIILTAAEADADFAAMAHAYLAESDHGPHRGIGAIGGYLRAEQAAERVDPDADVEAAALLLINSAFGRAARSRMTRPDDADPRIPTAERLLATLERLLAPRGS